MGSYLLCDQKSLVTATTTRRKQQQEMIRKALLAEEERKRVGRENFPMTTVPITQLAAYEPALHHGEAEHEEGKSVDCMHFLGDSCQLCSVCKTRSINVCL